MRAVLAALVACLFLAIGSGLAEGPQAPSAGAAAKAGAATPGSVSSGFAGDLRPGSPTLGCTNKEANFQPDVFPPNIGVVTGADGQRFTVPGPINEGPLAVDIYNNCLGPGDNPDYLKQLKTVVIDKDGVEITGYIFADNYFELYVNGQFVARDPVPMTPFNSNVVRFRARYPMTYAIKGIDWETRVGLGMEYVTFNIGDGGFIAYFSDGNGTNGEWRAETFYIAPLDDPGCVRTAGGRDSTFCHQATRPVCAEKEPRTCKALHFPIPGDWNAPRFDDSRWPKAVVWPPAAVTNQQAYTGYTKLFGDAEFIWTRNIKLDNLVLARQTVKGPKR
jgi:hypothetical protein